MTDTNDQIENIKEMKNDTKMSSSETNEIIKSSIPNSKPRLKKSKAAPKILTKTEVDELTKSAKGKKVKRRKKLPKNLHQKPEIKLPLLLKLELPKVEPVKKPKSTKYHSTVTYFQGTLFQNEDKIPIIQASYECGKYDHLLRGIKNSNQNDFASIQYSIRKELDKNNPLPKVHIALLSILMNKLVKS